MRLSLPAAFLLAVLYGAASAPLPAQETGLVRLDPCTGRPVVPAAAPAAERPPPAPEPRPEPDPEPAPEPAVLAAARTCAPPAGAADPEAARRNRQALRLGRGAQTGDVRLGPAASVSVPTAFGVDAGELFLGVAYQGRTRYTREDDAAVVAGLGLGTRRVLAVELALTSYSTIRGSPLETGGVSVKLHRSVGAGTSVAAGWENALLWGDSDDAGSLYLAATRLVRLRADAREWFSAAVFTLGVGNGRFRFEEDDAAGRETVNVFGAVGVRVNEPLSLVADWTGQDLNLAASVTPVRRVPVVLTAGVADVTGRAGDGARLIVSLGYGISIRQPF